MSKSRKQTTIWSFIFSAKGLVLGIFVGSLIIAIIAQSQGVELFSRASSNSQLIQVFPNQDPYTKELYDIVLTSDVRIASNSGVGTRHIAESTVRIGGSRVQNLSTIYAVKQRSESPHPNSYEFVRESSNGQVTFVSNNVRTIISNCLDLYTNTSPTREAYLATMCYKDNILYPNAQGSNAVVIYSPTANPFFHSEYIGDQPTVVQIWSTAFNKYESKLAGYEDGELMTRVNFVALDTRTASPQEFKNTKHIIQALSGGISNEHYALLCSSPVISPQKYLQISTTPKPGLPSRLIALSEFGNCTGSIVLQSLETGYMSFWMDGGLPVPGLPSSTPTPTATPSATPTSLPSSPTPTPISTQKPRPSSRLTPQPIKDPTVVPIPKLPLR